MDSFDNGGAFGVGAELFAEVFQEGGVGDAQGLGDLNKIHHIGLHPISSTLLLLLNCRHFVPNRKDMSMKALGCTRERDRGCLFL